MNKNITKAEGKSLEKARKAIEEAKPPTGTGKGSVQN
jgi:hypothetical protein